MGVIRDEENQTKETPGGVSESSPQHHLLGLPRTRLGGRSPRALYLDLEQLLKSGPAPAWALLRRTGGETRRKPPPTRSPGHAVPMTSLWPRLYAKHLSLSFISLIEMVSSGSFYAVLTAPHLFAPPGCCAAQTEGGGCPNTASGLADEVERSPPGPLPCPLLRYLSLPVHTMCHYILHLYFDITLFYRLALL